MYAIRSGISIKTKSQFCLKLFRNQWKLLTKGSGKLNLWGVP